jgi:hypothetical protein
MTQIKETSINGRTVFENIKQHEHHKIIVSVSNYISEVNIKIEEIIDNSSNYINLDKFDRVFSITDNGDTCFVLENMRIDNLVINFVSGSADLKLLYEGF